MRLLTLLVSLALFLAAPVHAGAQTPAQQIALLEADYDNLAQAGSVRVADLDALLRRAERLSAPGTPMRVQRAAALLSTKLLSHQYSVLESPDFARNKGGAAALRRAIAICQRWLARTPDDYDFLNQLHDLSGMLGEPTRPIIARLLHAYPNRSWPHFLAAVDHEAAGQMVPAMRENLRALVLEKDANVAHIYLEKGAHLARTATCSFADELFGIYDDLPDSIKGGQYNRSRPLSAEARTDLAAMLLVRQRYLAAYEFDKCVAK
jgi:hypothetical protein